MYHHTKKQSIKIISFYIISQFNTYTKRIKNIDYAPLILFNSYNNDKNITPVLTNWFKGRSIPSWRDDLDLLLVKLNISSPEELLDKAFGLSLSDQYWVKPADSNIEYKDINFFEHDFKDSKFTNATFSSGVDSSTKISLISSNNTTDGRLKKTWIIENNKRYLLKGGYKNELMQPFNEVLASMICERLGFNHIKYTIEVINGKVVSKCECFINTDTELIPAHQILYEIQKKENVCEEYIKVLENKGINNVREKLENMFILDYLILNEDRHLNNFGIIRNVNNLNWIDIKDIKRIDLSKLAGVVDKFDELLHKYQSTTRMTDRRINKICTLLISRINKLENIINK